MKKSPPNFNLLNDRIVYLDLLRIWAINAVVLLHAITPILANAALYGSRSWYVCVFLNEFARTGVPLFLMISGSLLLSDESSANLSRFYRKRLPRLIIPLLCWHTIYYFYHVFTGVEEASLHSYFSQLLGNGSAYHMWFVYSLLGMYLLTPFLKHITDSCSMKALGILLVILMFPGTLRPLWNTCSGFYVYLFDPLMECYFGYFLFGYILSKIRITKLLRVLYAVSGIGGFLLGFLGNLHACSPEGISYPSNGGYTLNHYLLAGALFLLIRDLSENRPIPAWLTKCAASFSDITFGIYWIHVLALDYAQRLISLDAAPIYQCILHFFAVMAAAALLMFSISKVKLLKKLLM